MNWNIRNALATVLIVVCALVCAGEIRSLRGQTRLPADSFFSEWRPNKDTGGIRYVGNKACVECHAEEAGQLATPMAQALEVAPAAGLTHARLTFVTDLYFQISRQGNTVLIPSRRA